MTAGRFEQLGSNGKLIPRLRRGSGRRDARPEYRARIAPVG
jgi:hypothetical protein